MADILRQVRFGGIDIEEEGGQSEKGNRKGPLTAGVITVELSNLNVPMLRTGCGFDAFLVSMND